MLELVVSKVVYTLTNATLVETLMITFMTIFGVLVSSYGMFVGFKYYDRPLSIAMSVLALFFSILSSFSLITLMVKVANIIKDIH